MRTVLVVEEDVDNSGPRKVVDESKHDELD